MRIPIAVQLALLVLSTSLLGLAIISIATWVNNYDFVVGVKSQGLSLTASLKAGQIASDLQLIQSTCKTVVTRILIQSALRRFYAGNHTDANWVNAIVDVQSALGSGGYSTFYQAILYSRNGDGNPYGVLNVTSTSLPEVVLPYTHPNGTSVVLGDAGLGYPPALYPNLTYTSTADDESQVYAYSDFPLNTTSTLLLGPLQLNSSFSLLSITLPIINNTSNTDILGYMTLIADASGLQNVLTAGDGIDSTGVVLLLGPARSENIFSYEDRPTRTYSNSVDPTDLKSTQVRFIFDPAVPSGHPDRHSVYRTNNAAPFTLSDYPAAYNVLSKHNSAPNNASSQLSTTNEQGSNVAVGVARPRTSLVDWVLIIEETHAEAWAPVNQLRKIILACVFGTAGFIALVVLPLAHFSVSPIRRLKVATEKSIQPPRPVSMGADGLVANPSPSVEEEMIENFHPRSEKDGGILRRLRVLGSGSWRKSDGAHTDDSHRKTFRVPGRVAERRHLVTDELTELTGTFNAMSDELMIQYRRLEERVAERTRELEASKKAAETANESKTLFIANISHELKTPLNGILGMCAVCMGDDDLPRIKKSLQVLYKSGDLLLHLLNDLLTFSKNEIDQAIRLDEKEFSLADIKSQISTIFEKQVQEKHITFNVNFVGGNSTQTTREVVSEKPIAPRAALGPPGTGRLKDMVLLGDQHRILQVLINLVSNSLKFTPEGGGVQVRIRCVGEAERPSDASNQISFDSRPSHFRSRASSPKGSRVGDQGIVAPFDLSLSSQPRDGRRTPSPTNLRTLVFEFEVEDTGLGIPAHLQQRVFEPFVQGDLGLNRKYGGTGLGLSICSQLSRIMGGTIALDSTEGKGTTFTLNIPLKFIKQMSPSTRSNSTAGSRPPSTLSVDDAARPGSNGAVNGATDNGASTTYEQDSQPRLVGLSQPFFTSSAPASSIAAGAKDATLQVLNQVTPDKIRVLVAEDNVVNQEVVLRMLKLEDIYDVTVAKDGQEAYDTVKMAMQEGNQFDLIFMDIQMPNLDGLQSTRLIRQMGFSAPIVALSAFAEESNIKDCMDSGMNMFLSKPIRRPALKQVLQEFATIIEEPETATPS